MKESTLKGLLEHLKIEWNEFVCFIIDNAFRLDQLKDGEPFYYLEVIAEFLKQELK